MRSPIGLLVLSATVGACAPPACSDPDRQALRDVQLLAGSERLLADDAERRLVARGRESIVLLETGLYDADARGRMRVVRALERIGAPEAAPVLSHLVARDPDPEVREAAQRALERLTPP